MATEPTWIWRVGRRAFTGSSVGRSPRTSRAEGAEILRRSLRTRDGPEDVEVEGGETQDHQDGQDGGGDRHQPLDVDLDPAPLDRRGDLLVGGDGHVPPSSGSSGTMLKIPTKTLMANRN